MIFSELSAWVFKYIFPHDLVVVFFLFVAIQFIKMSKERVRDRVFLLFFFMIPSVKFVYFLGFHFIFWLSLFFQCLRFDFLNVFCFNFLYLSKNV